MYFTYSPANNRFFVGDRGNDRVVVYDAGTFSVLGFVPTGQGVFHQAGNTLQNQLWVVNDVSRTATVINMLADPGPGAVLATVPVPAALGGTIHDIILDANAPQAFITVNGGTDIGRFSTNTFAQTGTIANAGSLQLHVDQAGNNLFVISQGTNQVRVFDPNTLTEVLPPLAITAAHGFDANASEAIAYVTNISGSPNDLFAINAATNTVIGSIDTPLPTPHNIAVSPDGSRLYLTHSGTSQVTFYTFDANGVPVLAGTLTTGSNPFAIATIPAGTVVPEPATLTLLLLTGSTVLAGAAWRRRRQGGAGEATLPR
jgi:DNA-binding beta-propeller fold protein YncE